MDDIYNTIITHFRLIRIQIYLGGLTYFALEPQFPLVTFCVDLHVHRNVLTLSLTFPSWALLLASTPTHRGSQSTLWTMLRSAGLTALVGTSHR